jgi:hypothetical protein
MYSVLILNELPQRPSEYNGDQNDAVWETLTYCWSRDPSTRDTAGQVQTVVSVVHIKLQCSLDI